MEGYIALMNWKTQYCKCKFSPELIKIQHNPNQYAVRTFCTHKLILKFIGK